MNTAGGNMALIREPSARRCTTTNFGSCNDIPQESFGRSPRTRGTGCSLRLSLGNSRQMGVSQSADSTSKALLTQKRKGSSHFEEMQAYVSPLKRPSAYHVSIDPRFPRLWEEWGRHADHAEPHIVEYEKQSTDAFSIGNSLSITTVLPEFVQEHQLLTPHH